MILMDEKGLFMKYIILLIQICIDKAVQIKLNFKRNWKYLKREFKKEPILYKRSKVFRRNFVKYTRLYKGLNDEQRMIELEFIDKSKISLDIVNKTMITLITSFTTLFIPFQVNVFITEKNQEIYGIILVTGVSIALVGTLFLFIFLLFSSAPIKQYLITYGLLFALWCVVLFSPVLDNNIIYHLLLSSLSFICLLYLIWRYLSYEKEILIARKLAMQKNNLKNTVIGHGNL